MFTVVELQDEQIALTTIHAHGVRQVLEDNPRISDVGGMTRIADG
jgi:hypothetical protein